MRTTQTPKTQTAILTTLEKLLGIDPTAPKIETVRQELISQGRKSRAVRQYLDSEGIVASDEVTPYPGII